MSPFKNSLHDLLILMDVTLYIPQEINILANTIYSVHLKTSNVCQQLIHTLNHKLIH